MSAHDGSGADPPDTVGAGEEGRRRRLVELLGRDDPAPWPAESLGKEDRATARFGGRSGLRERLGRVCLLAAAALAVDGAGVTVMAGPQGARRGARDQLASTGSLTRHLEDLQLTVGEGPCLDAYDGGLPVLVGDLAAESTRWLGFGPEALAAGAAAVFSLPLQVGAVRLGTLDLNRRRIGPLSGEQLADALVLAGLATEALLELPEHPDRGDADPDNGPDGEGPQPPAGWLPDVHAEVHVASGMVSVQQGIAVGAALLRIRAQAFTTGEAIRDLARRIIDHDLVLDAHEADPDPEHLRPEEHHGPPAPDPENDD